MITTEGYRDILHIARHKKPLNFSNYQDLPWQAFPIVRRRYRLTVAERITTEGEILGPSTRRDPASRSEAAEGGGRAVAVCFLFSFLNPTHEARVAEIVREEFPKRSCRSPRRCSPVPRVRALLDGRAERIRRPEGRAYVRRLEDELRALGVRTGLHLMTSASGVSTAQGAIGARSTCSCPGRSPASWAASGSGARRASTT